RVARGAHREALRGEAALRERRPNDRREARADTADADDEHPAAQRERKGGRERREGRGIERIKGVPFGPPELDDRGSGERCGERARARERVPVSENEGAREGVGDRRRGPAELLVEIGEAALELARGEQRFERRAPVEARRERMDGGL